MTRQIFLNLLLVTFFVAPFTSITSPALAGAATTKSSIEISMVSAASTPASPVEPVEIPGTAGLKPPVHKMHVPVMEELAKVHRFHRERLKKIKKHERKCWISAKLLLLICHVALLVCAYLHATH